MSLVNYGIMEEQVHLRAHVCVIAGKVYMYTPENGRLAIASGKYQTRLTFPAYARFEATANGYIIPPTQIPYCQTFETPLLIAIEQFSSLDSPTVKGQKALNVVCNMVRLGMFCPASEPEIVTDKAAQISGSDLVVLGALKVQVKCDFNGGEHPQATGNLYLQISERNLGFI